MKTMETGEDTLVNSLLHLAGEDFQSTSFWAIQGFDQDLGEFGINLGEVGSGEAMVIEPFGFEEELMEVFRGLS
jgi:hypothetical protein